MIIYIYSTQIEIGQIIQDQLSSDKNICFLFTSPTSFAEGLLSLKNYPDLLILDFVMYNHDFFNMRRFLTKKSKCFPIIFYNDPCLIKSTRQEHWHDQLRFLYNIKNKEELDKYTEVFTLLAELVESEELSPYIKLMQKPLPIPDKLKKTKLNLDTVKNKINNNINNFREKVKLPNNLFYLLKLFSNNTTSPLSLKDIQVLYKNDNKLITLESIKVHISNLRKHIKKDPLCNFRISTKRGLYLFERFDLCQ